MNDQNEYQTAISLMRYDTPDVKRAYSLLVTASEEGDDRATYALATWYLFGNSVVQKDEKRGVDMLKSLSDSFVAEALFDLAVSYDLGKHVEQDDYMAFSLFMRAALLGDKDSCDQVSQFYAEGLIVEYDESLVKAWKKRSELDEREISPPYRLWLSD